MNLNALLVGEPAAARRRASRHRIERNVLKSDKKDTWAAVTKQYIRKYFILERARYFCSWVVRV